MNDSRVGPVTAKMTGEYAMIGGVLTAALYAASGMWLAVIPAVAFAAIGAVVKAKWGRPAE